MSRLVRMAHPAPPGMTEGQTLDAGQPVYLEVEGKERVQVGTVTSVEVCRRPDHVEADEVGGLYLDVLAEMDDEYAQRMEADDRFALGGIEDQEVQEDASAFEMVPVRNSSNIDAVGYDRATQELHVKFHGSGITYVHGGVPPETHEGLMNASSAGSYFARSIRGQYQVVRQVGPWGD